MAVDRRLHQGGRARRRRGRTTVPLVSRNRRPHGLVDAAPGRTDRRSVRAGRRHAGIGHSDRAPGRPRQRPDPLSVDFLVFVGHGRERSRRLASDDLPGSSGRF